MVLKRVKPGDRFRPSAELHNSTVDLILRSKTGGRFEFGSDVDFPQAAIKVQVHNTTGGIVNPRSVYGLSDSLFDPATSIDIEYASPAIEIAEYDSDAHGSAIAIVRSTIGVGDVGEAYILGLVWADVEVSDAGHTFAAAETGETLLQSSASGTQRIVWKAGGTGTKKCLVMLGGGGSGGGAIVLRGTAVDPWDAAEPLDITFDEAYGTTLSSPTIEWYNTHNHVFGVGADILAVAKLDTGTWIAEIASAEETHHSCDSPAVVLDGGDVDDIYPYGAVVANSNPPVYGVD